MMLSCSQNNVHTSHTLHVYVFMYTMFIVNNNLDLSANQELKLFDTSVPPISIYADDDFGKHVKTFVSKFKIQNML